MRHLNRANNTMRTVEIVTNYNPYAEGSCLIKMGNTHVLCTASIEEFVPSFLKDKNQGWVTAEYGMLPRSTHSRMKREVSTGKVQGRTQEIQRLIGRSLRSVVDLRALGARQIIIDCDVIQADGGTRTAAITGGYVAMHLAIQKLLVQKIIKKTPITHQLAAISCGVVNGNVIVDLDYSEDSNAEVDANFVMTGDGKIIEIQSTAESEPFSQEQFHHMLKLSSEAIKELIKLQNEAITHA
jgi:ribonuclease PH